MKYHLTFLIALSACGFSPEVEGPVGVAFDGGGVSDSSDNAMDAGQPDAYALVDASRVDANATSDTTSAACDPITNTGCPANEQCTADVIRDNNDAGYCVPIGNLQLGSACTSTCNGSNEMCQSDCEAKTACTAAGIDPHQTCRQLCVLNTPTVGCPTGQLCASFADGIYGVCQKAD